MNQESSLSIRELLYVKIRNIIKQMFGADVDTLQIQPTNAEFEGTHTLVCFTLTRASRKSPEETARIIGEELIGGDGFVEKYNVIKGFLNLVLADRIWFEDFLRLAQNPELGRLPSNGKEYMVEYSSPNTNKPLHLGHLRNNFLGWSVGNILEASGFRVHRVQIINDRGIHICKSMAAWKLYGDNETPQSTGMKGDHLVGKYYVAFDKAYKAQTSALVQKGMTEEEASKEAPIMKLAVDLLRKWEEQDKETLNLWKLMNGWVYEGFDLTYKRMGVTFDKLYFESETYLKGKEEVMRGLKEGIFFKKRDGSVWVDLTGQGLDEKVLLRADGTSVYITQDIGTAVLRFRDYPSISGQVYTVGNEQEYHFKVLFLILDKLGYAWAKHCHHLSYGMVDLPSGKMKSREGTVVDADDLMDEMVTEAERQTLELGKIEGMDAAGQSELFETIGLGALKFFLLKVDPKKRMLFDPNESIQLQGFTGPFIQYTYARIRALLRKADQVGVKVDTRAMQLKAGFEPAEREVLALLSDYELKLREAAATYSPAIIANYTYELAKEYNKFYQSIPVLGEGDPLRLQFRVAFSGVTAGILEKAMGLLGIVLPERM